MKEVSRIIGVLDVHQSLVVGTIAGPHSRRLVLFTAQEIDVGSAARKGFCGPPEVAHPSDLPVCLTGCLLPDDHDLQGVVVLTQRKRRGSRINTAGRAMHMLEHDLRPGRRPRGMSL